MHELKKLNRIMIQVRKTSTTERVRIRLRNARVSYTIFPIKLREMQFRFHIPVVISSISVRKCDSLQTKMCTKIVHYGTIAQRGDSRTSGVYSKKERGRIHLRSAGLSYTIFQIKLWKFNSMIDFIDFLQLCT